jgi:DNA-binding HxlR family transcriptional regulator
VDDEKEFESDRQRAEVFDALGHPTRIAILKALDEGPQGFADLKKKTDIESSGHLTHHLLKLEKLIKTDEFGKYCLSDQGRDALLTVQTVEQVSSGAKGSSRKGRRFSGKIGVKTATLILASLLIASTTIAVLEYNQITTLQSQIAQFNGDDNMMAFYIEFGLVPTTNVNSSFAPPVSMLLATRMGLESEGWNKTSLQDMRVSSLLANYTKATNYTQIYAHGTSFGNFTTLGPVFAPPADYSAVTLDNVVYRYVWMVSVQPRSSIQFTRPSYVWVDAATGEIVAHPPFL